MVMIRKAYIYGLSIALIASCFITALVAASKKAPDFTLYDIDNHAFNLSEFRGKVVILDFMATWCVPCNYMMKNLKEISDKYPDIVIISIDVDSTESVEQLRNFKEKYNASWIFAIDTAGVGKKYSVTGIPKTVIINPEGEISFAHVGKISISKLSAEIEKAKTGHTAKNLFVMPLPLIAFLAGILSFFSPCAFPLLPGYMAYYVGKKEGNQANTKMLRKAFFDGMQPAFGILIFYAIIGIPIIFAGDAIKSFIPLFEPLVGSLIIFLGIEMIAGLNLFTKIPSTGFVNKISNFVGKEKKFGLVSYGILYGAASTGCVLPIFIGMIFLALSKNGFLSSILIFLSYVIGMASLMIAVTIIIALSKHALIDKLRVSTKYMEKFGGIILVITGIYLIYYYLVTFNMV